MATEYGLKTFEDIVDAIAEAIGIQSSDSRGIAKIKRFVNMYYLDEVIPFKEWRWLRQDTSIVHKAYYNVDTATVTPESTTVTLSTAPNVSYGSFKGYKFSVDGSNKVYTIASHTSGSTTLTLTSAFQEDLNSEADYKIWRDRIDLPTDAAETIEITHAESPAPMLGLGPKDLTKHEVALPKREGFPVEYATVEYYSPSGDGTESDRYRQTRIYPSITQTPVTLNLVYTREATDLIEDADEPIIPVNDRIVLYYGAGAMAWSILQRNEEMAAQWHAKANAKLARMAGNVEDGFDTPSLTPTSNYINNIRKSGLRNKTIRMGAFGGQSSVSIPKYLADVTINGGTLTGDLNVAAGVLIDGVDISSIASGASVTEVTLPDNTSSAVAATFDMTTAGNIVFVWYSITMGVGNVQSGQLALVGSGASAAHTEYAVVSLGTDVGVTFNADTSGSNLRLLYGTTSTGTDRKLQYRVFNWISES